MAPVVADEEPKTTISWAEQVEATETEDHTLPESKEEFDKSTGIKTVTEYKRNEEGKKVKIIRQYKTEQRKVSKSIAKRKSWKKYGAAEPDKPGPNPHNTIIGEDVFMQFISSKDDQQPETEEEAINKMKAAGAGPKFVSCRICKGDHFTSKCPYRDTLGPMQENLQQALESSDAGGASGAGPGERDKPSGSSSAGGKYVPPNMREGAARGRGESMHSGKKEEAATIRVTNLPEDTRDSDLQELFRPFGPIQRIYLAKDKVTGQSKGFAFINFHKREDAARAIAGVSGFGYDHLILNVEWAKPSGNA